MTDPTCTPDIQDTSRLRECFITDFVGDVDNFVCHADCEPVRWIHKDWIGAYERWLTVMERLTSQETEQIIKELKEQLKK